MENVYKKLSSKTKALAISLKLKPFIIMKWYFCKTLVTE